MLDAQLSIICPRCGTEKTQRFYGPCADCRSELVNASEREKVDVEAGRFEPKLNVVPNHVATKD